MNNLAMMVVDPSPTTFLGLPLCALIVGIIATQLFLLASEIKKRKRNSSYKNTNTSIFCLSGIILAIYAMRYSFTNYERYKNSYYFGGDPEHLDMLIQSHAFVAWQWIALTWAIGAAAIGPLIILIKEISNKSVVTTPERGKKGQTVLIEERGKKGQTVLIDMIWKSRTVRSDAPSS